MSDVLRRGSFIDAARIRRVSTALLAFYAVALAALLVTSDGMTDYAGRPLGTDFSNVYAAGRMAADGRAAEAWDWPRHHAEQKAVFADDAIPFYGWHYPPFFLIAAAALSILPYTAAWLCWMAATAPLYLMTIRAILPERAALLAALAFPAVFLNVTHGQNGFLTAALLGGALVLLDRRPLVAGVLIGLLAYKPQFGLLIPLALAASGRWRVIASAAATVVILSVAATALFGVHVWSAFLESAHPTRTIVLEQGATGWEKIQSVFSALRALGAPLDIAYAGQAAIALLSAAGVFLLWRSKARDAVKAAGLIVASLLATPYVMDYDFMALAPAIAFLAAEGMKRGFGPYEKSILALVFLTPLAARGVAEATLVPLGLLSLLALAGLICAKAAPRRRVVLQPAADCVPL